LREFYEIAFGYTFADLCCIWHVAQAQAEKATLLTCDKILTDYPCSVIYVKPKLTYQSQV